MKINAVQFCNPISKIQFLKTSGIRVNFTGEDVFEKQPYDFDEDVKLFHKDIEKTMGIKTSDYIEFLAENIVVKTGVNIDDVYKTLGILTQYSSYKSLDVIKNKFNEKGIERISNLKPLLSKDDNLPVCLSNVFHYISIKNFDYKKEQGENTALILDSNLLNIIKHMDDEEREIFKKDCLNNTTLYYIENFENGYNFLTQDGNLEDLAVNVLNKTKKIKTKANIEDKVRFILNKENFKKIKELGLKPIVIKNIIPNNPEKIADNLNQIIASEDDIKIFIKDLAKGNLDNEQLYINFLKNIFTPISPEKFNKLLKSIHNDIDKHLKESGKSWDNVYFLIPETSKSFTLTNYVYQNINKDVKFIRFHKRFVDDMMNKLNNLPKDSVVVIADDYMISGSSMTFQEFPYNLFTHSKEIKENKISLIFAPLVSMYDGVKSVKKSIFVADRENIDKVIYGQILPDVDTEILDDISKLNIFIDNYVIASTMPYMGPDNNCGMFIEFFQKFLYSPNAQKEPLIDLTLTPFLF